MRAQGPPRSLPLIAPAVLAVLIIGGCGGVSDPSGPTRPATASATAPSAVASASPSASLTIATYDVDGRRMTVECRGTGDPTLLFLVGTGAARTQMRAIEDEFVSTATVCDYDRADRPDDSVTDRGAALEGLLEAAGIRPPYVLVGQSVGGDLAWHFATTHPDRVRAFIAMNPGPFWLDPEVMAKVWTPEEIAAELPPPGSEREEEALALQSASPPEAMPYVIMLSTVAQCDSPTDICGRFYPAYEAWGQELASRSPRGRFVSVEAGHEIFAEDPEAVVREIRGVLGG